MGIGVSDEGDVSVGLDAGEWVSVGGVLLGAAEVDTVDIEGDDSAFGGGEFDLVHDDVSVGLVLQSETGVGFDEEASGGIGEKGEFSIGFWGVVEADAWLGGGANHEVGIAIGGSVVVIVVVIVVVVVVVVVVSSVGVVLLASLFFTLGGGESEEKSGCQFHLAVCFYCSQIYLMEKSETRGGINGVSQRSLAVGLRNLFGNNENSRWKDFVKLSAGMRKQQRG